MRREFGSVSHHDNIWNSHDPEQENNRGDRKSSRKRKSIFSNAGAAALGSVSGSTGEEDGKSRKRKRDRDRDRDRNPPSPFTRQGKKSRRSEQQQREQGSTSDFEVDGETKKRQHGQKKRQEKKRRKEKEDGDKEEGEEEEQVSDLEDFEVERKRRHDEDLWKEVFSMGDEVDADQMCRELELKYNEYRTVNARDSRELACFYLGLDCSRTESSTFDSFSPTEIKHQFDTKMRNMTQMYGKLIRCAKLPGPGDYKIQDPDLVLKLNFIFECLYWSKNLLRSLQVWPRCTIPNFELLEKKQRRRLRKEKATLIFIFFNVHYKVAME